MKKIFLILAIIIPMLLNSQNYIRIGKDRSEVINEFKNYKLNKISEKDFNVIKANIDGNVIIYIFDEYNICDHVTIIPKDDKTADNFRRFYRFNNYNLGVNKIGLNRIHYSTFTNIDNKQAFVFRRLN